MSYCGLILRGGSTGGGIWNTGSLRSAWKKPQIKWRTFTALLRSTALQPAKVGPWLLTTHLTLSLSLSLFLPLAPFPHVPCGVVQLTPPSLVWNRRPYSLLGLAQSKKEAQFRLHSTSRPVQVSSQPGFGYMCSFYWSTFTVCCI